LAVEDADTSREPLPKPLDGLGCEGDLRDEDEAAAPLLDRGFQGLEIDLGLAAAGDAVQEVTAGHGIPYPAVQTGHDLPQGLGLIRSETKGGEGGIGEVRERVSPHPAAGHSDEAPLLKGSDDGAGGADAAQRLWLRERLSGVAEEGEEVRLPHSAPPVELGHGLLQTRSLHRGFQEADQPRPNAAVFPTALPLGQASLLQKGQGADTPASQGSSQDGDGHGAMPSKVVRHLPPGGGEGVQRGTGGAVSERGDGDFAASDGGWQEDEGGLEKGGEVALGYPADQLQARRGEERAGVQET
jgi:hypothetical protein